MSSSTGRRRAGLLIPLFSCPSTASWGIGDIGDIEPLTAWLAAAGQQILQLLPLNEMAPGQKSPYSAISAMAIDPIFISVARVTEFAALGGEASLSPDDRETLAAVRRAPAVAHQQVRGLKQRALRASFERFLETEWRSGSDRDRALRAYVNEQAWWLEDYGLFRALHAREHERAWMEWPEALQRRDPPAIDRARRELADEVLFHQYLQWLAGTQWQEARQHNHGVALFGDLPFMVDVDSADVWVRQHQFRLDMSVGAPPDAFSATGQDWGMPVYQWSALAAEDYLWLRERARRSADLFDGYRVDHLVGFYRTYGRAKNGGDGFFSPAEEPAQRALGETVLELFRGAGAEIIAEDLGTVPDFVRASLARLGIPGYRVFRWERQWHDAGRPFRDPSTYPARSVAASGTHDTEPVAVWWAQAPAEERRQVSSLAAVRRVTGGADLSSRPFDASVRDTLLEILFASGSELLLIPIQDAFGWRDRINEPATVSDANWTYRLPWPVDRLDDIPEARERKDQLAAWASRYDRR
ncbi:MAG: malQ 1 [Acidobacteria bacterium]|nr:malQ 1 [Acidobacteriota bacterium]